MSKQKQKNTTCSELWIFMHWSYNSMNNLLSYYGLVDARISASDKDLPVQTSILFEISVCLNYGKGKQS